MAKTARCDILYIEDNADDVFLLKRAVQKSGIPCVICVVASIREATCYLKGESPYNDRGQFPLPNLIVTDLALRIDDGLQFVTWLRNESALANIQLICLSGIEDPLRLDQIRNLGVAILKKSVLFEDVMQLVRTFIQI